MIVQQTTPAPAEFSQLLAQASKVYAANFPPVTNFAKCIFLSWYCSVGDCTFCYRSVVKDKIEDPKKARRSKGSIYVESLIAARLGWDLEFLTGGYGIYPTDELVEIARVVSLIFGKKIWLNLGAMSKPTLDKFRPYTQGVVASIETINPKLRAIVTPSKPLEAYLALYKNAGEEMNKSCAFVVGIGEEWSDIELLHQFIRDNKLSRITLYALQPVKGTPFTQGPETTYYASWVAKTRIAFPTLEIVAGITGRRTGDVATLLAAGANYITKFPATRYFGSAAAKEFEDQMRLAGRSFKANLTKMPDTDWVREIDALDISAELKADMKRVLPQYVTRLQKGSQEEEVAPQLTQLH